MILMVLVVGACGALSGSGSRSTPPKGRCHYDGDCRPMYPQGVCIMPWTFLCGNPGCAMNQPAPCSSTSCGEGRSCEAGTCLLRCGNDSDCKKEESCLEYTPGAPRVCVPLGTCARDTQVP
ncbi:hypothetical protein KKD52_14925 [Myxococcota bacterium]|nr:hypothetical protein [Myxococcota bacterium]MBU1511645.1 hypothetical protein [Myxococcota bacterium]